MDSVPKMGIRVNNLTFMSKFAAVFAGSVDFGMAEHEMEEQIFSSRYPIYLWQIHIMLHPKAEKLYWSPFAKRLIHSSNPCLLQSQWLNQGLWVEPEPAQALVFGATSLDIKVFCLIALWLPQGIPHWKKTAVCPSTYSSIQPPAGKDLWCYRNIGFVIPDQIHGPSTPGTDLWQWPMLYIPEENENPIVHLGSCVTVHDKRELFLPEPSWRSNYELHQRIDN